LVSFEMSLATARNIIETMKQFFLLTKQKFGIAVVLTGLNFLSPSRLSGPRLLCGSLV
jgi:hypothetical protein